MRNPIKHILGTEAPPCHLVAAELLRRGGERPESPTCVVVPTREAARALKEQLALACAAGNGVGAFTSPRIVQVSRLLGDDAENTAPACVSLCVWQEVLQRTDSCVARIFPKTADWREEAWLHAAENMQRLFHTLAQEGVEIGGKAWQRLAADDSRWEALLTLHHRYTALLQEMGLVDADTHTALDLAEDTRVILACVPGLSGQVEKALSAAPNPVEVWIPCDEPYASWFDAWGRPGKQWLETTDRDELGLSRADWKERLIVAGDAWALASETAHAAARANAEGGGCLHAVGLGLCDSSLEAAVAEEFALHGASTYRPQGIPFAATSWQRVLDALADMAQHIGRWAGSGWDTSHLTVAPLVELLHQPPVTDGLDIPDALAALRRLRDIRAKYLPDKVAFLLEKAGDAPELKAALDILLPWIRRALTSGRHFLKALQELAEAQPIADDTSLRLARGVRDACQDLLDMGRYNLSLQATMLLLGRHLAALSVNTGREGAGLSLNGWMELLYCPAEHLVVAGMHDKEIPERWPVHPLLTRRARQALGIRGDEERAARDAFILRTILGSRKPGAVTFVFSQTDTCKDPVAPSPLLFTLCPKNRLPELVAHFFDSSATRPCTPGAPYDITGWQYLPLAQPEHELGAQEAAHAKLEDWGIANPMHGRPFSPSLLADFLACPLRFWLKRVRRLKDDDADDTRETLQMNNVGDCLHRVLERFVRQYPTWEAYHAEHPECSSPTAAVENVRQDLFEIFRQDCEREYGDSPMLPQQFQRENMASRLAGYAPIHAALWAEGWQTARDGQGMPMVEYKAEWTWHGYRLNMKLDRVDERIDADGRRHLRIIDYKTGAIESCSKKHLVHLPDDGILPEAIDERMQPALAPYNRKRLQPHRWVELQLPLYSLWAQDNMPDAASYETAYICLDRNPEETRILPWAGVPDKERGLFEETDGAPTLIENAGDWALACMGLISEGRCLASAEQLGWGKPKYDLFEGAVEHVPLSELFLPVPDTETSN